MGRCVSMWTHAAHQNRISARSACTAEQADPNFAANHDNKSFAEFYGKNSNDRNAFGKCVSSKAKAALDQQKSDDAECGQVVQGRAQLDGRPRLPREVRQERERPQRLRQVRVAALEVDRLNM